MIKYGHIIIQYLPADIQCQAQLIQHDLLNVLSRLVIKGCVFTKIVYLLHCAQEAPVMLPGEVYMFWDAKQVGYKTCGRNTI